MYIYIESDGKTDYVSCHIPSFTKLKKKEMCVYKLNCVKLRISERRQLQLKLHSGLNQRQTAAAGRRRREMPGVPEE